jgi:hypothetical protein
LETAGFRVVNQKVGGIWLFNAVTENRDAKTKSSTNPKGLCLDNL